MRFTVWSDVVVGIYWAMDESRMLENSRNKLDLIRQLESFELRRMMPMIPKRWWIVMPLFNRRWDSRTESIFSCSDQFVISAISINQDNQTDIRVPSNTTTYIVATCWIISLLFLLECTTIYLYIYNTSIVNVRNEKFCNPNEIGVVVRVCFLRDAIIIYQALQKFESLSLTL